LLIKGGKDKTEGRNCHSRKSRIEIVLNSSGNPKGKSTKTSENFDAKIRPEKKGALAQGTGAKAGGGKSEVCDIISGEPAQREGSNGKRGDLKRTNQPRLRPTRKKKDPKRPAVAGGGIGH